MRICLLAPPWVAVPPPGYGGTELVLDVLARALRATGHDVLLVTTGDATCPVEKTWCFREAVGVGRGGAPAELRHVAHGYKAAARWGADVVHDHTLVGPLYSTLVEAPPVVTTNHGPFDAPDLGPLYRAVRTSVPVIAISHDHAAAANGGVDAVIHHGIDVDRVPVGRGDGGYAAFLGRMHPDKGVHVAARIAHAANVPLRIAAKMREPHEVEYFHREVEPLLGDGVEYVGEVGGGDKQRFLGDAMCLLNPITWSEPFGMVMIEALACGTPVVATPNGSVPEIIDDGVTGHLRSDEAELVQALASAAELDRDACRRAAETRFSAERMANDHVAVYEDVIARVAGTTSERARRRQAIGRLQAGIGAAMDLVLHEAATSARRNGSGSLLHVVRREPTSRGDAVTERHRVLQRDPSAASLQTP